MTDSTIYGLLMHMLIDYQYVQSFVQGLKFDRAFLSSHLFELQTLIMRQLQNSDFLVILRISAYHLQLLDPLPVLELDQE